MVITMAKKSIGERTFRLENPPAVLAHAAVVGKKEAEGPLGAYFDIKNDDSFFGEETWEKAESAMQRLALERALTKSHLTASDVDLVFAGDLLNQCCGSVFGMREASIPFFGLYGACSTMAEALAVGSMALDGSFANRVACVTSSHFCSAERQFRMPLEYGGQRPPTAQWTATGAGCVVLESACCADTERVRASKADLTLLGDCATERTSSPQVTHFTTAKIIDAGIKDANNMGAAMAPAAYDTLSAHFRDTGREPSYYDLIVTGDLGRLGHDILLDMFARGGTTLTNYNDCGLMIYDLEAQDMHSGGSGCGCSAAVLCGNILRRMGAQNLAAPLCDDAPQDALPQENIIHSTPLRRVLFAATGAMMSTVSAQQGESIPSICYAIAIEC